MVRSSAPSAAPHATLASALSGPGPPPARRGDARSRPRPSIPPRSSTTTDDDRNSRVVVVVVVAVAAMVSRACRGRVSARFRGWARGGDGARARGGGGRGAPVARVLRGGWQCMAALGSPQQQAAHTGAQVVARIGAIEMPHQQWPELLTLLLNNMTNAESSELCKMSTLEARPPRIAPAALACPSRARQSLKGGTGGRGRARGKRGARPAARPRACGVARAAPGRLFVASGCGDSGRLLGGSRGVGRRGGPVVPSAEASAASSRARLRHAMRGGERRCGGVRRRKETRPPKMRKGRTGPDPCGGHFSWPLHLRPRCPAPRRACPPLAARAAGVCRG